MLILNIGQNKFETKPFPLVSVTWFSFPRLSYPAGIFLQLIVNTLVILVSDFNIHQQSFITAE